MTVRFTVGLFARVVELRAKYLAMDRFVVVLLLALCLFGSAGCDWVPYEVQEAIRGPDTMLVYVQRQPPNFVEQAVFVQSLGSADSSRTLIVAGSLAQSIRSPLWSPTGEYISFSYFVAADSAEVCDSCTHSAGGTIGLAITRADGSDFELVNAHVYLAAWLPKEDRLAYAAPPPDDPRPQELILYVRNIQTGTTQEVARIDKHAMVLAWDAGGRGFYTSRYDGTSGTNQLLFVDLQASAEPIVVASFRGDKILEVSQLGDFVQLERQITPWGAGRHYVMQLVKYDLTTQRETVLVTAWDFILTRLMDEAQMVLVSHPTASTDSPLTSISDWHVRHRLLDLENGTAIALPDLPGTGAIPLQVDVMIKE